MAMLEMARPDPPSPPARTRTQRAAMRLTHVLGVVYSTAIGVLIPLVAAYYFLWIRPKFAALQPVLPSYLFFHTVLSISLLFSAGANYLALITVQPGSPSPIANNSNSNSDSNSNSNSNSNDMEKDSSTCTSIAIANSGINFVGGVKTSSQTWRYCDICTAPKPPRSHHCRVCNRCFHRHCHHCPAMGRCIGQNNYGYYFRFISTAYFAALLLCCTAAFILKHSDIHSNQGNADTLLFTVAISAAVAAAVGILLLWHVYLLLSGQTTIEVFENWAAQKNNINNKKKFGKFGKGTFAGPFHQGIRNNIRDAFGDPPGRKFRFLPWWSVLFFPVGRNFSGTHHSTYNFCLNNTS